MEWLFQVPHQESLRKLEGFDYIVILGENNWVKSEMWPLLCILAATIPMFPSTQIIAMYF